MSMTLIVTRNVEDRYHGFLNSVMLEIAPGVYTSPRMTKGIRERVWAVLDQWHAELRNGAVVMTWRDQGKPGGQGLAYLGEPPRELVEVDGMVLVRRNAD